MNLRFSANSIRFKISVDEYQKLCNTGELNNIVYFPGGNTFEYKISAVDKINAQGGSDLSLTSKANFLHLCVSKKALESMNSQRPSKEGIMREQKVSAEKDLVYSLQIDIKSRLSPLQFSLPH